MHELLTPNDWVTKEEAIKRLKNNNIYNKDIKTEIPDIYEIIKDSNCLGYGYELPINIVKKEKGNNNQFLLRENNALKKLILYSKIFNKICFVIGDTHLRSEPIEDLLTPSPIYEYAKNINIPCEKCYYLKDAMDKIFSNALSGDVVLLSPGSGSQDQYVKFEDRGDEFKKLVEKNVG